MARAPKQTKQEPLEVVLWKTADKLRKNIDAAEYKHVVVSNALRPELEKAGLSICGTSPDGRLVETIELKDHPYFEATQAHPEFKSRPNRPHPLFVGLVKAAIEHHKG